MCDDTYDGALLRLEVTMPGNEDRLGVDFAEIYANSELSRYLPLESLHHSC